MSKTIIINAGSPGLKWQLYQMPNEEMIAKGIVERIDSRDSISTIEYSEGRKYEVIADIDDHEVAVKMLLGQLIDLNILDSYDEIIGVGHRVVADGGELKDSVVIMDEILEKIEVLSGLASLHSLANAMGVKIFRHILLKIIGMAAFDMSFHTTMPGHNYLYSAPHEYYEKLTARKYEAHGTSHRCISQCAAGMSGRPIGDLKITTCHLGNGASITAVDGGKSVDTSVGFTPLTGVITGTRSGGISAPLLPYLVTRLDLADVQDMVDILNKKSDLLGSTDGLSSDMCDIRPNLDKPRAQTAYDISTDRVREHIGSYVIIMNDVDAIVFTAGIGENVVGVHKDIIDGVTRFGCEIDDSKNNVHGEEAAISTDDSEVKLLLVPTDGESMIACNIERLK